MKRPMPAEPIQRCENPFSVVETETAPIHDLPELRERTGVFRDRRHAGAVLAKMLAKWRGSDAIVMAIPAGGVPVAAEIARRLELPLDLLVVSKILLPWNSESGFGAISADGEMWLNEEYIRYFGLDESAIREATDTAAKKVKRRARRFRGDRPWPDLAKRPVIVVDDGIAAGSTFRVAISTLRNRGASEIIVAVPTAHLESLPVIARMADEIYCPNIRSGRRFAVAEAYQRWYDVSEQEVEELLRKP